MSADPGGSAGDPHAPLYVLGHSEREFRRLQMQGKIYEDATVELLQAAGVGPGMRVLDIGCGVGDVSLLAARLVGPEGVVIGIDHSEAAVEVARDRATAAGMTHVDVRVGELDDLTLERSVDALVGRFILMHQADPAATLQHAARHVRAGGAVAILESHMELSATALNAFPPSSSFARLMKWEIEVIRAAGAHTDMGLRLPVVFSRAGLPRPQLRLKAYVDGGPGSILYEYTTESLRSMLPLARKLGVTDVSEDDLDRLQRELEAGVVASEGVIVSPLVIAAWARLP